MKGEFRSHALIDSRLADGHFKTLHTSLLFSLSMIFFKQQAKFL